MRKPSDSSDNQPKRLTHSYRPPVTPKYNCTQSMEDYRAYERNNLIQIARGELKTHMHSTIHRCDESCPGHYSNIEKTKLEAQQHLSGMGIDWRNIKVEEHDQNELKEEINLDNIKNNFDSEKKSLRSNSIFKFSPKQDESYESESKWQCTII